MRGKAPGGLLDDSRRHAAVGAAGRVHPGNLTSRPAAFAAETGYTEGRNVATEYCRAENQNDRLPARKI